MNRWEQGRATIDALLATKRLERVPANRELAYAYIEQARAHLITSQLAAGGDPIGEFQLAYDAARKALGAVVKPFQWMRPLRNDSEYPSADRPVANSSDAAEGRRCAAAMVEKVASVLDHMPPYGS